MDALVLAGRGVDVSVVALVPVGLLLAAAGLALWPSRRAEMRVRGIGGTTSGPGVAIPRRLGVVAAVPFIAVFAGIGPAIAAGIVVAVWLWRSRRSAAKRVEAAREAALGRALSVMVAEMSVGAPMVSACRAAAGEVDGDQPEVAATLARIAAHVELGGELDAGVVGDAQPAVRRLGDAWSISVRHGLPMVSLLEALHRDLAQRREFAARTDAGLAGPRATAMVLAGLPLLGLGLGQLMGAHPIGVLLGTPMGSVLLVVGVALAAAGVLWADAIVAKVLR